MRLASFNLLHGMRVEDGVVDPERLREAVRLLDADVVALQEVDRAQERSGMLDLTAIAAEAAGVRAENARFVPALAGTPGLGWRPVRDGEVLESAAYGIGLVSRRPVREWHTIALGQSPMRLPVPVGGPKRRLLFVRDEPRMAVAAVLDGPSVVRTVICTHLSFAPGWNIAQLARLARAVRKLPAPVVLLGDLNLPGAVPAAVLPGWRSLARIPTFPADRPRTQLDHALVRDRPDNRVPAVRGVQSLRMPLSDHRALVVDLSG